LQALERCIDALFAAAAGTTSAAHPNRGARGPGCRAAAIGDGRAIRFPGGNRGAAAGSRSTPASTEADPTKRSPSV
jgi:hypothetical protein